MKIRVGLGIDVHQLEDGLPFWLGGIRIPHSKGAKGHSDADVLIHAICDAMLGAANLGDIGKHFPDNDPQYRGIDSKILLLLSVVFYVCDLICVLFWCPFRVWFMKNRCCTTCRIFNWDHIMMFSPLFFVPGFFTWSLCGVSIIVLAVWEISFALHPERFYEGTNEALRCSNCTDRLCGERRNCAADIPSFDNITKGI